MASQWFYADAQNQQQGPIEGSALANAFRTGTVSATTLVWREGMPAWVPLAQVAAQLGLIVVGAPQMATARAPVAATGNRIIKPTSSSTTWVIVLVVCLLGFIPVAAILAAIALPAYQDYTVRARVSGAVVFAYGLKTSVAEFYASENRCPGNGEGGIGSAESYATTVVESIHVGVQSGKKCAIRMVFKNLGPRDTAGSELVFAMDNSLHWTNTSTLPAKFLPTSLRNAN